MLDFVTVLSTDNLKLPGLLYHSKSKKKAAIYLHGNGDSGVFYHQKLIAEVANSLGKIDVGLLAFNNRGARYKKNLLIEGSGKPGEEEKYLGGAHYELIEDCVKDIDGAIETLKTNGYKDFYVIGFSTGANKICVYEALKPNNEVSKYIHAGPGDDVGVHYSEIGAAKFKKSLSYAKKMIKSDKPLKVLPKYTGMNPFSAQSAFDILNPDGMYNTFPYFEVAEKRLGDKKLFKEYSEITKPMLVVFGEFDEFTYTGGGTEKALKLLKDNTSTAALKTSEFRIIPDTNHGFYGKERELGEAIVDWL